MYYYIPGMTWAHGLLTQTRPSD